MSQGEILLAICEVMEGSGQQLADEIANETRNGCFEHCDGWPAKQLGGEESAILVEAVNLDGVEEPDPAQLEALTKRASRHSQIAGAVQAVCRVECPGAYSLFVSDDELYDEDGNTVVRECPIKARLAETAINFGSVSTT